MSLPYVTEDEIFGDKVNDAVKLMKATDKHLQDCMRFDVLKELVTHFDTKNEVNDVRFEAVRALVLRDNWPVVRPITPGTDGLYLHLSTYIPKNSQYTAQFMRLYYYLFEMLPWVVDRVTLSASLQLLTDAVINNSSASVEDIKLALDIRVNQGYNIQYLQDNWALFKQPEVLKHMLELGFQITQESEFGKMFATPTFGQHQWFQEARKVAYSVGKRAFKAKETARAIKRQKRQE